MGLSKKSKLNLASWLAWGAVLAVVFSAVGYLGRDIWLASTQWLLVAVVLAVFGVYLKLP